MVYRHEVLWGLDFASLAYQDYRVEIDEGNFLSNRIANRQAGDMLRSVEDELGSINFRPLSYQDLGLASSDFIPNPQGSDFLYNNRSDYAFSAKSDDGSSLAIGFRGTDSVSDTWSNISGGLVDWLTVAERFEPLVNASISYALESDVDTVYFFGHSRGGAVAEWYYTSRAPMAAEYGLEFKGVAFASPGIQISQPGIENGFYSYERSADWVANITPFDVNSVTEVTLETRYLDIPFPPAPGTPLDALRLHALLQNHSLKNYATDIVSEGLLPPEEAPDLTAKNLFFYDPVDLSPGQVVDLEWSIGNAGGYFLGQTETRIFLSPEPYYTDQAIDLLSYNVNGMSPGRGLNHGGRVTLPEHLEPGEYHLLAGINIEGAVDELKYENNFTNSISFTVEDTAPAPAPIANDRNFSMDQGGTLTVSLLELTSNDFVPEGSSITVRELFAASTGQVRIEHGNAVFVPEADFTGTASFRYRIDDGQGNVDTATISVIVRSEPTVSPPPPPPEIGADLLPVATEVSPGTRVSVFDLFTVNAGSFDSYDEYWVVLDTRGSADGQLVDRRGNLVGEVQSNGQIHGFVFSEAGISRWAQKGSSDPAWWDFFGSAWPQNPDDLYIQAGNSYSDIIIVPLRLPESPSQQSEMFLEQRLRTFIDIDLPPAQPPTLSLTSANFDGASEKLFVDLVATDTANRGLLVELQLNAAASSLTLDGQLLEAGGSLLLSISSLRDGVALTGVNHGETLAFRLRVDDGQLTSDWVDFPVQIDIPNRPAVIYGGTGGVVLEDSVDAQAIQGRLFIADPDAGEDRFAEVDPAALAGDYGAFAFDPETGVWSYTLDNDLAAVQALPEGTEVTDSLTVTSLDGTASETITVTIRGVNDPATISGTRNLALDLGSGEWDHPAPSTEFTLLSEDRFPVSSDFNAIIQQELGPQAQLADWVDIKARYEFEGGGFLREAGLVPRDEDGINGGAVTRDGARFLSGDRHYFISWGEVHSGFASHDIAWYDGDPLHLGSWYTDQRLIAFSGEQEPSDGQLPGLASVSGQLLVIDPDAGEDRFRPVDPDALLGEFGTFSFNPETGAWSYVLDVAAIGADTSSLNGAVETLTVTSLDGTASETVTVDLIAAEPTENTPASIAGDSTGLVVEDDADRAQASGVLTVTDPDEGEDRFADVSPAALAGDYGAFAFNPESGAWSYTLDNDLAAVQALPEGAEVTDSLSVISFDGTASETITVTIRGVNDPASISGDTTGLVIEDDPEAQLVSGRVIVTDPDQGEDRFRPIGWEREHAADDPPNWQFVPMPVPHLLLSAIPQTSQVGELINVSDLFEAHFDDFDAFRVRLSGPSYDRLVDEEGNTVGVLEGDLQIASVFSGPNALVFRDLPPEDPFWSEIPKPLDEGTLFLDVADGRADIRIEPLILNAAASEIWSPPDGVEPFIGEPTTVRLEVPGSDLFDAEEPELQGDFGVFTFDAETGNWTYRLDNAAYAVQSLPEGAEVTDSLTVTSLDGTASETITVTIRGVNDPASIAGDSTGLVVEDDADRAQATGLLSVTDPDAGEDRFAEIDAAALAGDYGAFAFDPESGTWTYTLDNDADAVQALPKGVEVTDSLSVTSFDGSASETITVTIRKGIQANPEEEDLTPPVLLSVDVASATYLHGDEVTISFDATDDTGIGSFRFAFISENGNQFYLSGSGTQEPVTGTLPSGLEGGVWQLHEVLLYDTSPHRNFAYFRPDGTVENYSGSQDPFYTTHDLDFAEVTFSLPDDMGDLTPPVLLSVDVASATYLPGDEVTISFDATDDTGIGSVRFAFISENGNQFFFSGSGTQEPVTGTLPSGLEGGVWQLHEVLLYDTSPHRNFAYFRPDGTVENYSGSQDTFYTTHDLDFAEVTFSLPDDMGDLTPPVLLSVDVASATYLPGDEVTISFDATDDTGIGSVRFAFISENGNQFFFSGSGTQEPVTGTLPSGLEGGVWQLHEVLLYDTSPHRNFAYFRPDGTVENYSGSQDPVYTTHDLDFAEVTYRFSYSGSPEELDGLIIPSWTDEDTIFVSDVSFGYEDIVFTAGSVILSIDTNRDGNHDTTITVAADFNTTRFHVENMGDNSLISSSSMELAENISASISGDRSGLLVEDDADRAQASGVLSITDPDAGEDRFAAIDPAALAGDYGSFSFDPESGEWTYTLDNDLDAVQALPEGVEVTDRLTVTSLDGTASETITVTIRGVNDPASIAGDSTGLVVEDDADRAQASGMLSVTDPDAGEDRFAEVDPAALAGDYGSFSFDPESGEWTYTLDNDLASVQALPEGAEVTDGLSVTSLDGTASETITVTILRASLATPEPDETITLQGVIQGRSGDAMDGVTVTFSPEDGSTAIDVESTADGFAISTMAGASGRITGSRDYSPETDGNVTALDALNVLRLAVGLSPSWGAASPMDFIAADINQDGQVTALDALEVLRAAVGLQSENQPRWFFMDSEADLNHINRNDTLVEEGIRFDPAVTDISSLSMTGVLLGNMQEYA